jgi:tetratricopeptide (TPR) repeat protein
VGEVHFWLGGLQHFRNELREAVGCFHQVLAAAHELGDEELLVIPSAVIGRALTIRGQFGRAAVLLRQAVGPLEAAGNWPEWTLTAGYLGVALAALGDAAGGVAIGRRVLAFAERAGNPTAIAAIHGILCFVYLIGGELALMRESARIAADLAQQTGDRLYQYVGAGMRAWAESRLGFHQDAAASLAEAKRVADSLGGQLVLVDTFSAATAEVAFNAGRHDEALALAQRAAEVAAAVEGHFGGGFAHRVWGQALAAVSPPQWAEAETHLAEAARLHESGSTAPEVARTHVVWGQLCRDRGDVAAARAHWEQAAALLSAAHLAPEVEQTQALLAHLT